MGMTEKRDSERERAIESDGGRTSNKKGKKKDRKKDRKTEMKYYLKTEGSSGWRRRTTGNIKWKKKKLKRERK